MPPSTSADPFVLAPGDGVVLRNPTGGQMVLKVLADQSGGSLTAVEASSAAGEGPPLHVHPEQDELIYVLDGAFRVRLGDRLLAAEVGASIFIPRGIEHTWQVTGNRAGRFLATFTPAAPEFESLFRQVDALPVAERGPEALARLAPETGGLVVVGPPLARSHPD